MLIIKLVSKRALPLEQVYIEQEFSGYVKTVPSEDVRSDLSSPPEVRVRAVTWLTQRCTVISVASVSYRQFWIDTFEELDFEGHA